jgi:hypothetical protein
VHITDRPQLFKLVNGQSLMAYELRSREQSGDRED